MVSVPCPRLAFVVELDAHQIGEVAATDVARDWMIYDVGGARTSVRTLPFRLAFSLPVYQGHPFRSFDTSTHPSLQRAAWYPYFDDAHAILFLAPISCFDEMLAEDRRVNRLEDSFLLWKGIVQSKLLAKCIIVRASLPRFSCFFPARARRANSI